jgi:peptidoglycan/xylan/chitin deacetylase (PgdA/CDA1 family)
MLFGQTSPGHSFEWSWLFRILCTDDHGSFVIFRSASVRPEEPTLLWNHLNAIDAVTREVRDRYAVVWVENLPEVDKSFRHICEKILVTHPIRNPMEASLPTRLAKLGGSVLVFGASQLKNLIASLIGKPGPGSCVIVYYHGVAREHRASFARQMDMVKRWATPLSVDRRAICQRGHRYVAITFDDGFENLIENALPELESRKIPSTMFVVAECLGQPACWNTHASNGDTRVTSAEQLGSLQSTLMTIGSHSLTHPDLTSLNESDARREIADSRRRLQEILGKEVTLFSFPYGTHNNTLVQYCREAGYERVFTVLPRLAFANEKEFVSGRVEVAPTDWPLEFLLKILGAYSWLPVAFSLKRKMKLGRAALLRRMGINVLRGINSGLR